MGDKKEYIERGAVLRLFDERYITAIVQQKHDDVPEDHKKHWKGVQSGTNWCKNTVLEAPAVDVVEVRHGEWKLIETERFCDGGYYSRFCCPLCFREIGVCHDYEKDAYNYAKTMYPYCHCGAKMDGERKGKP